MRSGDPEFHQSRDSFDSEFSDFGLRKRKKRRAPIVTGLLSQKRQKRISEFLFQQKMRKFQTVSEEAVK